MMHKNVKKVLFAILCILTFMTTFDLFYARTFLAHIPAYLASTAKDYDAILDHYIQQYSNGSGLEGNFTVLFVTSSLSTSSSSSSSLSSSSISSSSSSSSRSSKSTSFDRAGANTYRYFIDQPKSKHGSSVSRSKVALQLLSVKQQQQALLSPYLIASPDSYPNYTTNNSGESSSQSQQQQPAVSPREAVMKGYTVVSGYNTPKWYKNHNLNLYNLDMKRCPVKECYIDLDGELKFIADVLMFFPGLRKTMPPKRPPGQIWAYASWESPEHYGYPSPYSKWKNQFNWTVGYRMSSDWFFPNNLLTWRDPTTLLDYEDYVAIAKNKTKMVTWWVSHCSTSSAREKYVREMQKYIDVDIYGKCGKLKCSKTEMNDCEQLLSDTYRFYLSFENSLCQDYVTEKFFRMIAYRSHVVPVGRSGFDYNRYIPGNFVVNAANFKDAKSLALYLKDLANDVPRYARMLQEKDKLDALNRKVDWCDVCKRLRNHGYPNRTYSDIREWSHGPHVCRKPNDIPLTRNRPKPKRKTPSH